MIDKTLKSSCCKLGQTQIVYSRNKIEKTAHNSVQNSLLSFGKLCAFFTIFVLCQWRKLSRQAATSSARETLVASNFGFGQTRKFRLFQSRFLATLLEDCYWKVVLNKLLQNIILKKFCLTTNSAQNFIAKFPVSCSFFFTIFVLC